MLADLLDKLNRMQEAQARPDDFKASFEAFIARADEHLEVLRPFFPILVQFLPAHKELHAAAEAPRIEATDELDWTAERGLAFPIHKPPSCIGRQVSK